MFTSFKVIETGYVVCVTSSPLKILKKSSWGILTSLKFKIYYIAKAVAFMMQHVVQLSSGVCVYFVVAFAAVGSLVVALGVDSSSWLFDSISTVRSCVFVSQSVFCLVSL